MTEKEQSAVRNRMIGSFDYIKAKSWHEAAKILDTYGSKASVLAGGTDLLPAMKLKLHRPEILVDLSGIPETKGIGESGTNDSKITSLSPLMTLSQLCNDSFILETYPALALAASKVGSPQLRNMGTLGGNICLDTRCLYYNQSEQWRRTRPPCFKIDGNVCHVQRRGKICLAEFQADTVPILIALNADLKIVSIKGERIIPLDQFYSDTGHPSNLLGPSELIESPDPGLRASWARLLNSMEMLYMSVFLIRIKKTLRPKRA